MLFVEYVMYVGESFEHTEYNLCTNLEEAMYYAKHSSHYRDRITHINVKTVEEISLKEAVYLYMDKLPKDIEHIPDDGDLWDWTAEAT